MPHHVGLEDVKEAADLVTVTFRILKMPPPLGQPGRPGEAAQMLNWTAASLKSAVYLPI